MQSLKRKWKIYVIHHSHTDIGYTERQEKIEQYQVDFIRQAIDISEAIRSGARKEWSGFKWTCETFWAVERFLQQSSDELRLRFADALRRGDIELSATYLNMTELVDYELMCNMLKKAGEYGHSVGVEVNSALTADINGYSWGYAQSMYDAGIRHLLSCVHTHHGMFPIGRKQFPFYWETPQGDQLLVWNGEHYTLGNDLGVSPGALQSYTIRDEFQTKPFMENHWEIAEARIGRYLKQLENEEYPYDFIVINVMGVLRDNASPNGKLMEFIHRWNKKHGHQVEIEMSTLGSFFEHVKKQSEPIPVYKGDWPDWWSDGVASTAIHTQIYREAQRTLRLLKKLDPECKTVSKEKVREAENQLIMYAEHTWGYHSSVSEPWHPLVQSLAVRKEAYAANASTLVLTALDKVLHKRGEVMLEPDQPFRFKVLNPFGYEVEDIAHLYLEGYEPSLFQSGLEVVEEQDGALVPYQSEKVSRGFQISVKVSLKPFEEKVFILRDPIEKKTGITTKSTYLKGCDGVCDVEDLIRLGTEEKHCLKFTENAVETPHVRIEWKAGEGIVSWIDKQTGQEMLDPKRQYGAFTPVYEVTPSDGIDRLTAVRRKMGRNRKGMNVKRSAGILKAVKEIMNGSLFGVVELIYETPGMSYFSLFLKVYNDMPRVDVSVRMHKESVWEPENVYISMPLGTGEDPNGPLWIEKAGALIRPGEDQLPGTVLDYYCIQEGLAYVSSGKGLLIATPDTPLIQIGPLEYGTRLVHGQQTGEEAKHLYAWVLTNYWETNFKATLGGFYEFRYIVHWGSHIDSAEKAIGLCHSLNTGIVSFRTAQ